MASELDQAKAVGHGILALVNTAILLAILAVFLSPGSQAAGMIRAFFAFLAWLVGQVIQPIVPGSLLQFSDKPAAAGATPTKPAPAYTPPSQPGIGGWINGPQSNGPQSEAPTPPPLGAPLGGNNPYPPMITP